MKEKNSTYNVNIRKISPLISPIDLKKEIPTTKAMDDFVYESRETIKKLMQGRDSRFLVIVGPCSIHDPKAAMEYAKKLAVLKEKYKDTLFIVMRVYFEKPRTTIGWKGLINDPDLNDTFDMNKGLRIARKLLIDINQLGLPVATEVLDPISPQYISKLITWASIGARTTESQTHREMASGLSMPVGFKNNTDGSTDVALAAMESARHSHSFIGINNEGKTCIVQTSGNPLGHVILRGGKKAPNYTKESIDAVIECLKEKKVCPKVLVDCSHANSGKAFKKQEIVLKNVVDQVIDGNKNILGVMIESNLIEGSQSLKGTLKDLQYGVSITDECIGWEKTESLLEELHQRFTS